MEKLPPKQVQCKCGHVFTIDQKRKWCEKCAKPVFYDQKEKRSYQIYTLAVYGSILGVVTFLTYIFIEMIAKPWLSM
jgi:hypothetical protein